MLVTLGGDVVGRVSRTFVGIDIWLGGFDFGIQDVKTERADVVPSEAARNGRAMARGEATWVFHIGMVFGGCSITGTDEAFVGSGGSLGADGEGYGQSDWLEEKHF